MPTSGPAAKAAIPTVSSAALTARSIFTSYPITTASFPRAESSTAAHAQPAAAVHTAITATTSKPATSWPAGGLPD